LAMADKPKVLPGANDTEKLEALSNKTHKEQVVWFLNSFWDSHQGEAETTWKWLHKFQELDLQNHETGTGIDEMNAHRFLEHFQNTHTVQELRGKLRETGAIGQKTPKLFPIIHFLVYQFGVDFHVLVNASQGDNAKEIAEAQHKLDQVSDAFAEADSKAREATAAYKEADAAEKEATSRENAAKAAEANAIARENECREAEAPFKQASEELAAAVADLKAQEDSYNSKMADLEAKSSEGSVVQQNKAKNELAQLKAENPLPLRRAKITQEAASKKADKARAPFEASLKQAEAARAEATETASRASKARQAATNAKKHAEDAKRAAEHAVEEARLRLEEAEAYLEEIKSKPGCAHGATWWMERELHEKKKFMPTSKGGITK